MSDTLPAKEDMILACAFISDEKARADVLDLFAFLETLRAIPARVTEPLMGEIRLRWWWEAIEEIDQGRPVRYHPLTESIKALILERGLAPRAFYDLIEGQMPLLDKGALTTKTALEIVDRGEVIVARLAAQRMDPDAEASSLIHVARLYGLAELKARRGLSDAGETELAHLRRETASAARKLPASLMPLALPAVTAPALWRGQPIGPLMKRIRMLTAFLTGRI